MSEAIRFLLNGELREVEGLSPTMTVLDYLRLVERKCGTKEGCAEGDCGACTVVLAEPHGAAGLGYRAVTSCIQFLPTLDGKALITVEGLCGPDGRLHPVQRAMVDCHGSQCGFCTPGFVMSLFALWHENKAPSKTETLDALAGNLCRCTGYRPILEAARRMYDARLPDRFDLARPATRAKLDALRRANGFAYTDCGREFLAPRSLAELGKALAGRPDGFVLAGGTDFGLWVTKQHRAFERIVYLGQVAELKEMRTTATHLEIGGAVSWTEAWPAIARLYPDFGLLIRRFGSVPIRNAATLGGNLANASPIGDGPPPLIALGASVVLHGAAGEREVPLDEFFKDYRKTDLRAGEVVARLRLPLPAPDLHFGTWKLAKRFDQDIASVCGAFAVRLAQGQVAAARIAYGGMAAMPKRALGAEAALLGRSWTLGSVHQAMAALERDFTPITDFRATRAYRGLAAKNLLLRFYHASIGTAEATRVAGYG
ncbi:MAG: xanthine dehydrogenase small subunit [Pseudomonadota bacterium]